MEGTSRNDHVVLHCGYSISIRMHQHAFVCGKGLTKPSIVWKDEQQRFANHQCYRPPKVNRYSYIEQYY